MAYVTTELRLLVPTIGGNNGAPQVWALDGTDSFATVGTSANYISDAVARGVRKGDVIKYRKFDNLDTRLTSQGSREYIVKTVTSSGATLDYMDEDDEFKSATIVLSAGATNTLTFTITCTNLDGTTVAAAQVIEAYISRSATGQGLTSTSASGSLAATTGAILTAYTAKKHFSAVTATTGIFVGTLVDSAKTEGEYIVVKLPNGKIVVSAATETASYG